MPLETAPCVLQRYQAPPTLRSDSFDARLPQHTQVVFIDPHRWAWANVGRRTNAQPKERTRSTPEHSSVRHTVCHLSVLHNRPPGIRAAHRPPPLAPPPTHNSRRTTVVRALSETDIGAWRL